MHLCTATRCPDIHSMRCKAGRFRIYTFISSREAAVYEPSRGDNPLTYSFRLLGVFIFQKCLGACRLSIPQHSLSSAGIFGCENQRKYVGGIRTRVFREHVDRISVVLLMGMDASHPLSRHVQTIQCPEGRRKAGGRALRLTSDLLLGVRPARRKIQKPSVMARRYKEAISGRL